MIKFQEPETCDPLTLNPGDQVGCHDSGGRLRLLTGADVDGARGLDEIWVGLRNKPAETERLWDEPGDWPAGDLAVLPGQVALKLERIGWKMLALPLVRARRRIL